MERRAQPAVRRPTGRRRPPGRGCGRPGLGVALRRGRGSVVLVAGGPAARARRVRRILRRLGSVCDVVETRCGGAARGGAGALEALSRLRPDGPAARLVVEGEPADHPGMQDHHALALLAEARRRPLALLVEEIHLLDPDTRGFLARLLTALEHAPLVLVLTMPADCAAGRAAARKGHPMTISPLRPHTRPTTTTDVVLEVVNATEPDEPLRFDADGDSVLFGRGDDVCDLVVWSAINGRELSRVAGRIWRMGDRLWVQNLSRHHELVVVGGAVEALPPCEAGDPTGPGCSLPWGSSVVLGPGGCELHVSQTRGAGGLLHLADPQTDGLPPIPDDLLAVALALCEPLLTGATVPATYRQVSERAGLDSYKRARSLVAELCEPYLPLVRPGHDDGAQPLGRIGGGVWRFAAPQAPQESTATLRIPDYVLVARLLVRRHLVRREMLALLDAGRSVAAPDAGAGLLTVM